MGLIELHLYCGPLESQEEARAAEPMGGLIDALESQRRRLRELSDDGWDLFRYLATGVQVLVDTRRPDEDLTAADLP